MRVSRTRFSKRRLKRKTEFPIVAVVQKKRKPEYSGSRSFSMLSKKTLQKLNQNILASSPSVKKDEGRWENHQESKNLAKQNSPESFVENDGVKAERLHKREKRNSFKPQKKSRATIDYKNVILLRNLITAEGKILPRRINKLTAKQQRYVQKAIKSARIMGLVPFINKSRAFS